MKYGCCHLSIIPLRKEKDHKSELVSQFLYGDSFKIIKKKDNWLYVSGLLDHYEGWIEQKQQQEISEKNAVALNKNPILAFDLVHYVVSQNGLKPLVIGSNVGVSDFFGDEFDGQVVSKKKNKTMLCDFAHLYRNAPYLWGGKTPFGIDCSGLVQMVYRLYGSNLPRDAYQQAEIGASLSFIEESEPGDLAFFDNQQGDIIHVGILLKNHHIIHAHGTVRVDRIDQTGIFNIHNNMHSHKLRLIKRIV